MAFDLAAYLDRIQLAGDVRPDLATLERLARHHTEHLTFENLDAFLDLGAPRLDSEGLQAKLVGSRRGGWCFEHNLLLREALVAIGFEPQALIARVVWGREPDTPAMRTHSLLRVDLDGTPHLMDVGFGGNVLTGVLRLQEGVVQPTPHGRFRLGRIGEELTMEAEIDGAWRTAYRFDLHPQVTPLDYEAPNWFLATHPTSHFRSSLIVARTAPGRRYALQNRRFTVHHVGGPSAKRLIADPAELRTVLEDDFGIEAPAGLDAAFDRLAVE